MLNKMNFSEILDKFHGFHNCVIVIKIEIMNEMVSSFNLIQTSFKKKYFKIKLNLVFRPYKQKVNIFTSNQFRMNLSIPKVVFPLFLFLNPNIFPIIIIIIILYFHSLTKLN